jgi:Ca2+-binding RTX toxin-like protein
MAISAGSLPNSLIFIPQRIIRGTASNDSITGEVIAETIYGGGGSDTVHGRYGDDVIYGESLVNRLYGMREMTRSMLTTSAACSTP